MTASIVILAQVVRYVNCLLLIDLDVTVARYSQIHMIAKLSYCDVHTRTIFVNKISPSELKLTIRETVSKTLQNQQLVHSKNSRFRVFLNQYLGQPVWPLPVTRTFGQF